MFEGKAGDPSEAHFMCSNLGQAPGLINKHYTRLERLAGANTLAYYENL
jgi:hypothetical protein